MRWLHALGHALAISGSMTWEILWALILGFALSAVVQAVVRRSTIIRRLGDDRPRTLAIATGFGAASSSCSYPDPEAHQLKSVTVFAPTTVSNASEQARLAMPPQTRSAPIPASPPARPGLAVRRPTQWPDDRRPSGGRGTRRLRRRGGLLLQLRMPRPVYRGCS